MRILHVFDHSLPLHSGYSFRSRAILAEQQKLGWQTAHLTGARHAHYVAEKGKTMPDEETVDGLKFYRADAWPKPADKLPVASQLATIEGLRRRLPEVIKAEQPDLLHAHSPALNGAAAVLAAKRAGLPVVYEVRAFWEDAAVDIGSTTEGSPRYRLTRALETWVLNQATRVTTICQGLRDDMIERGIPEGKITVIPNAVDVDKFSTASDDPALAAELGLEGRDVLGFIGSFYAYEGLDLLLQAVARLAPGQPNLRLLLVGGGPREQALKDLATELGIDSRVIFTGRVPNSDVPRYYDLVDVLVYPRLPMRLTELVTPLKPLEAMARRRLVIASDVGGHKELIRDGETGTLFEAGSVPALADAIDGLLNHRDSWPERLENGYEFVSRERTWANSVGRYQAVYAGALA